MRVIWKGSISFGLVSIPNSFRHPAGGTKIPAASKICISVLLLTSALPRLTARKFPGIKLSKVNEDEKDKFIVLKDDELRQKFCYRGRGQNFCAIRINHRKLQISAHTEAQGVNGEPLCSERNAAQRSRRATLTGAARRRGRGRPERCGLIAILWRTASKGADAVEIGR